MASSQILRNKLALVTGGSGTIGQAIGNKLALSGADVILVGRNLQRLEKVAGRIQANLKEQEATNTSLSMPRVDCFSCDITQEQSVQKLFENIDENHPTIDLLVNNAGTNVEGMTADLSGSDFDWVMKVNVLGPFLCAREAMKRMSKAGGGRIINIGSLSALSPRPDSAPYSTSKFALNGLNQSLALDGREHNIAVGIIHPGNVQSDLLSEETLSSRQHEGFLEPDDVAECVATMASLPPSASILDMT
eukprot:CAMPEP_0113605334 /NCGR_PEP_ID=MMETSP0017_2-20120614/2272_1 /TAXON_ID=2856 /ORGANISM="Cylindrotheca closterium" /LENGTH=247 /DNA_ID=CAMNT_0000513817 /DNA_START=147 /DNA_END=886 /DNA_ORIENTATION=+ /assembly_acc=CAM_ASM_000147